MFEYIEFIICYGEGVSPEDVKREDRAKELVFARHLIMYFSVILGVGSYAMIGELMGKDHATISHALKAIANYIGTDKSVKAKIGYYDKLLRKVVKLTAKTDDLRGVLKPLEEQISELEQRCINLSLQVAFLKTKVLTT